MKTPRTQSVTGTIFTVLVFMLASSSHAGGRRRAVAVSPPFSAPVLVFLQTGPVVDAGTIAWRGGSRRSTVMTKTVTLRIGEPSRDPRGVGILRAFVETHDRRCTIRVDGVTLTTAPRVIRRNVPLGVSSSHRIEIDVPVTAPDGPLQTAIGWEFITE